MVQVLHPWMRLLVAGLVLLYTGIRTPDVLAERSWRSWIVLPVLLLALWFFGKALRNVLARRDHDSPGRNTSA
ncbi:hypothetical protein ACIG87_19660 [Micromonospora sp. NPDC051925]|uniref:hypothetical protein n=1 Tax=Micromonospora sp. NPDC051925 TaxID=3364288 RepID=UPI0037CBAE85